MKYVPINKVLADKISGEWGVEPDNDYGVKIIRTANFTNLGAIDFSNIVLRKIEPKKIAQKKLIPGDVIIEKSGGSPTQPVGRVVYFENPYNSTYLCNNFTSVLRPDVSVVFPKFLFYVLFYNHLTKKTLRFQNKTTGIINLKLENYLNSKIPLPPLDDQICIATVLTRAERLIAKRKESIEAMDELLKSTFLEMFGDPVRNEKGWEKIRWDNLFNTRTGKLNANAMSDDGEYPFFTCAKEIYKIDFYDFDCEALILAGNNATADYDVKYYKGKFNAYQRTYILELINSKHSYRFYQYHLEYKLGQLKDGSKGANTRYLTKQFLDPILFLNPPVELQLKFAAIVEKVESIKAKQAQSLAEMENLYASLSQRAFKGELDLVEKGD